MRIFLLVLVVLSVVGCRSNGSDGSSMTFRPREPEPVQLADLRIVRDFTWDASVEEPQAEWAPDSYVIAARSIKGLMLIREGIGSAAYRTADASSPYHPRFWGDDRLVVGPEPRVTRTEEGRISIPSSGLQVSAFTGDALHRPVTLSQRGYRPRPWGKQVVCSAENQVLLIDRHGKEKVFVEGFLPEPQPGGPGIAWQETPVFTVDYWSGQSGIGDLVIRWRSGVVNILPRGVHPRWTPWGGIIATRLHGEVPSRGPWYAGGSDVVHIAGPGQPPVVIASDAHIAEPHPSAEIAVVTANDGSVHLVDLAGTARRLFVDQGERPRWSDDGKRLMLEEAHATDPRSRTLHIYVLSLKSLAAD